MRKDYVKKCISAVSILATSSFVSQEEKEHILSATNKMLNEVWKVEYNSYKHTKEEQVKAFWNTIHTELECQLDVYKFCAWFGETVNPPGIEGRVVLHVQPVNTAEKIVFELNL
jgi:Na+-translocating ferredoxin:NAD+ oxidoreductase RnfG subunit